MARLVCVCSSHAYASPYKKSPVHMLLSACTAVCQIFSVAVLPSLASFLQERLAENLLVEEPEILIIWFGDHFSMLEGMFVYERMLQ